MDRVPDSLPGMCPHAAQYFTVVDDVRPLARDTWAVRVRCPELAAAILPGQFFMIRPESGSDPLLGRPFALYDIYRDASGHPAGVEFGFVKVGRLTSIMPTWQSGDRVAIWGPLGNGFPVPACRRLICVAGGIGQTPFLGVTREALGLAAYGRPGRSISTRPERVTLCYGVRSKEWLAGLDDFQLPGLELQIATDDGTAGHHGYVTALLQRELDSAGSAGAGSLDDVHVYICGPEPMMHAAAAICEKAGVRSWLSLETPMACGFGACFSCVTKVRTEDGGWDYRRTCVEGPVFPAEQLVLNEH
ncbi:MAG: Dihydroorotate oxidase electron transfer subunit [Planctomycetota bacterium]|jgi:dihydroorotate dehydrogenase electron transfer subunit